VLQVGLGLIKRGDGELLRHCTVAKTGNLRKDEPDPMAGLSSGSEFSEDGVVGGCLGVEEAVEVVFISHVAVAKVVSGSAAFSETLNILSVSRLQ